MMKIKTVCRFQDFLLRQFFCVADPVIEGILATFVSSFFCFASGSDRYILLITVYVLPPFMVIPDLHALTEIFDPFQIFRVLKNVLLLQFFLRTPTFSRSFPDKVCIIIFIRHDLPSVPFPMLRNIRSKFFLVQDNPYQRFCLVLCIAVHLQEKMLFMSYDPDCCYTDILGVFLSELLLQTQIRNSLNCFLFHFTPPR